MAGPGDAQGDRSGAVPVGRCANGHEAAPGEAGERFCTVCGAPMLVRCPDGHEVVPDAHCTVCGLPLTADIGIPGAGGPEAGPPEGEEDEPTHEDVTPPPGESDPEPARRSWLPIAGAALLVVLVGGGVYFAVSSLTGSSGTKTASGAAAQSSVTIAPQAPAPAPAPSTVTSTQSPAQVPPPSTVTAPPTSAPPTVTVVVPPTVTTPTTVTAPPTVIVPPPVTVPPPTTVTVNPPTVTVAPSLTGTGEVVTEYFAAINAGDYARAWVLGGQNLQGGSYDSFVQGFSTTAVDTVTILSVNGDTATIHLDALQTDGTHRYFAGTYTVRGGAIVAADIRQTAS